MNRSALLFCLWWGMIFSASTLLAHNAFESTAIARLYPDRLEIRMTTGLTTARTIEAKGGDIPAFDPSLLPQVRARLLASANRLFEVSTDTARLPLDRSELAIDSELEASFLLVYARPPPGTLRIRAAHVSTLPYGGTYLTLQGESEEVLATGLLMADELVLEAVVPPTHSPPVSSITPSFAAFFRLGIEHILTGYDHLLFLLGLIIASRGIRTLVGIVTCFTLAHSLTLALAVFGFVTLSSRVVEPLIAASIAFIGAENLLRRKEPPHRWLLTFGFGLIHGLGFAGVLQKIGLGPSAVHTALPLLAFNFGVEIGQLGLVLLLLPVLRWLQKRPRYERPGYVLVSAAIACAGIYWFLQRALAA